MSEELKKAQEELAKFLKENPHMQAYQDKITEILNKSGDRKNRLEVIADLIHGKVAELQNAIKKL